MERNSAGNQDPSRQATSRMLWQRLICLDGLVSTVALSALKNRFNKDGSPIRGRTAYSLRCWVSMCTKATV